LNPPKVGLSQGRRRLQGRPGFGLDAASRAAPRRVVGCCNIDAPAPALGGVVVLVGVANSGWKMTQQ